MFWWRHSKAWYRKEKCERTKSYFLSLEKSPRPQINCPRTFEESNDAPDAAVHTVATTLDLRDC